FISSSWLLTLSILIIPFMALFDKKSSFITSSITILLFIAPILYGLSWIFAKLFLLIPVINNDPNINYTINSILHFIIIFIIGKIMNTKKKNNNVKDTNSSKVTY